MRREDAIDITNEITDMSFDELVAYLIKCREEGKNVCARWDKAEPMLYSCDNYTVEQYYIIVFGYPRKVFEAFSNLLYTKKMDDQVRYKLTQLISPIDDLMRGLYKEEREQLTASDEDFKQR